MQHSKTQSVLEEFAKLMELERHKEAIAVFELGNIWEKTIFLSIPVLTGPASLQAKEQARWIGRVRW